MNTRKLKPETQKTMLKDLCKQISELPSAYLTEEFVEEALAAVVSELDNANENDHFGTESWERFFGYGD